MLNVTQRQMNLKFLDFYFLDIDGNEGTGTKQAYRDFQKAYGLDVDGIYGTKTDAKLIEVVKDIQVKIGTNADGIAGDKTIAKCKEYQKANCLAVDGICGVNTRAKLYENYKCKYFKDSEFTCKCGCGTNLQTNEIKIIADKIREYFGKPAIINSGTRCTKHNKNVGGVANSRHLNGKAIDIQVEGINGNTLLKYCQSIVNSGQARYTYLICGNAVHIDVL